MPDPAVQIGRDELGLIDNISELVERRLGQLGQRLLTRREHLMMHRIRIVHVAN